MNTVKQFKLVCVNTFFNGFGKMNVMYMRSWIKGLKLTLHCPTLNYNQHASFTHNTRCDNN